MNWHTSNAGIYTFTGWAWDCKSFTGSTLCWFGWQGRPNMFGNYAAIPRLPTSWGKKPQVIGAHCWKPQGNCLQNLWNPDWLCWGFSKNRSGWFRGSNGLKRKFGARTRKCSPAHSLSICSSVFVSSQWQKPTPISKTQHHPQKMLSKSKTQLWKNQRKPAKSPMNKAISRGKSTPSAKKWTNC